MLKRKLLALLLSAIFAIGVLAGCGSEKSSESGNTETGVNESQNAGSADSDSGTKSSDNGDTEVSTDRKTLTISQITNVSLLDPSLVSIDVDLNIVRTTNEGLYIGVENGYALGAAEKEELSDDSLTRTYTIRSDAKWSDGQPVTAYDFEYSWKRLGNPETGSEYAFMLVLADIKNAAGVISGELAVDELGIKALDEKTLVVETNSYLPYFQELLAFPSFVPVRQDKVEEYGDQFGLSAETTVSNGVFFVSSWKPGDESIVLSRNEYYYDQSVTNLDNIVFQTISEVQTGVLAFESGNIDLISISGDLIDQYKGSDSLQTNVQGQLFYIEPNLSNEYLANENIRLAIAKSINKQEIADEILKNGSTPAYGIDAENIGKKSDGTSYRQTANKDYLTYEPDVAAQYWSKGLEELGVSGFSLELLYDDTPNQADVAQYLQETLQTNLPGLTITLQQQPKKNRIEIMKTGEFDLGLTKWGPDYHDPSTMFSVFLTEGAYNHNGFSNEEYDSLVLAASTTDVLDEDARYADYVKAEGILLEPAYIFPIYYDAAARLINPDVKLPFDGGGTLPVYQNAFKN